MAESGWYPDPSGTVGLRYWDGLKWTDRVSAAANTTPFTIGDLGDGFDATGGRRTQLIRGALALAVAAAIGVTVTTGISIVGAPFGVAAAIGFTVMIVGLIGGIVSLHWSKSIALRVTGAKVVAVPELATSSEDTASDGRNTDRSVTAPTDEWLVDIVGRLADGAGIPHPEVAVYPSPTLNAFATGRSRNAAMVAVSDGLLEQMPKQALTAVLAHEIAHIGNGDMVTTTLIQGVFNTIVVGPPRLAAAALRFVAKKGGDSSLRIGTTVLQYTVGLPAGLVVMWSSRRREYRADIGAVRLVGAASVITALTTLRDTTSRPGLAHEVAALGVRSPHTESVFRSILSSHPDINLRIASLDQ